MEEKEVTLSEEEEEMVDGGDPEHVRHLYDRNCPKCGSIHVTVQLKEDNGRRDFAYHCRDCGHDWRLNPRIINPRRFK